MVWYDKANCGTVEELQQNLVLGAAGIVLGALSPRRRKTPFRSSEYICQCHRNAVSFSTTHPRVAGAVYEFPVPSVGIFG